MGYGMFINAGVLMGIAKRACRRTDQAPSGRGPCKFDALLRVETPPDDEAQAWQPHTLDKLVFKGYC